MIIVTFLHNHDSLYYVFLACYMTIKSVYYVICGPYVSDQAGRNRGPLIVWSYYIQMLGYRGKIVTKPYVVSKEAQLYSL